MNEDTATDAPITLVDLIDQLVPVPEPIAVSLIPQTGGWVGLAIVLACLTGLLLRRAIIRHRANAYRRAALDALGVAGDEPVAIAAVLRRAALAAYPRSEVAGLFGTEWLAFLDETGGGSDFRTGVGAVLAVAPYRATEPVAGLSTVARRWIRQHRAEVAS